MYLFSNNKTECCGCKACEAICPSSCITFSEDEESFVYPVRDLIQCTECHLCERVCPNSAAVDRHKPRQSKVAVHKSNEAIDNSSSGGAFTAICENLLPLNYKIYGAKLDAHLNCIFDDSDHSNGYEVFRKSKYFQSDTNGVYQKILNDLKKSRKVLFSGLPCQNAALVLYLKNKRISTDNIILIDILCHGVASQAMFDSYINEISEAYGKTVQAVIFRNKKPINGQIDSRSIEVVFNDDSSKVLGIADCSYLLGYHTRLFYRQSCYKCPFADTKRVGDVTLADAWGIEDRYPEWDSRSGVSMIFANTSKGEKLLESISTSNMESKDIELAWAISRNDTLRGATEMHPKRNKFFKSWKKQGFSMAVKKYAIPSLYHRIINRALRIVKRLIQ